MFLGVKEIMSNERSNAADMYRIYVRIYNNTENFE